MEKDKIIIQTILESAQKLLQRFGFVKTTMSDIAKYAGKGKSTLYHYFTSKDEIFNEVIKMEMDELFLQVKDAVDTKNSSTDKLKAYILVKINNLKEKKNLYHFAIESDINSVSLSKYMILLRNRYDNKEISLLKTILVKGVDDGVLVIKNNNIDLLSELLVSSIRGVEFDILVNHKYKSLSNEINFLVNILIKGLS